VTAVQVTLTVFRFDAVQADVTPVGADGTAWAFASPWLPAVRATIQAVADAAPASRLRAIDITPTSTANRRASAGSWMLRYTDQLVQASVAGLVVEVAAPPVAVTPVNEGMEKKTAAQASGAVAAMLASLVSVTASGLLA